MSRAAGVTASTPSAARASFSLTPRGGLEPGRPRPSIFAARLVSRTLQVADAAAGPSPPPRPPAPFSAHPGWWRGRSLQPAQPCSLPASDLLITRPQRLPRTSLGGLKASRSSGLLCTLPPTVPHPHPGARQPREPRRYCSAHRPAAAARLRSWCGGGEGKGGGGRRSSPGRGCGLGQTGRRRAKQKQLLVIGASGEGAGFPGPDAVAAGARAARAAARRSDPQPGRRLIADAPVQTHPALRTTPQSLSAVPVALLTRMWHSARALQFSYPKERAPFPYLHP